MLSLKEKLSKLEQQISEQEQLIEQHKCELVSNSINEFGNISIDDILYALQNKDFLSLQEKIEAEAGAKEAEAGEKMKGTKNKNGQYMQKRKLYQ